VQVALDAAPLAVGRGHDPGARGLEFRGLPAQPVQRLLQLGVELCIVDRELCPLGLDEAPLEEVGAEPALDRVPGDHANDDGREKEEVVVDEDLNRRRLQPYGHDLVADYDGQARPRGIGKTELQHGVCPRYYEKETRVVEVAG